MMKKIQREMWSTPTDALDLVSTLLRMHGCYVNWETDALHRLKSVIWSTAEQQILARQFGGIVIQDNTCLTNRCGLSRSEPGPKCLSAAVDTISLQERARGYQVRCNIASIRQEFLKYAAFSKYVVQV